jgi:hypothetical protein
VGVPKFWNFSILSVSPLALAQRVHAESLVYSAQSP